MMLKTEEVNLRLEFTSVTYVRNLRIKDFKALVEITHTLDQITRLSALYAKNLAHCHQINYLFSALVNAFCAIFKFVLHIVSNSSIRGFMVYNNITLFNS